MTQNSGVVPKAEARSQAVSEVTPRLPETIILSGVGEFLAELALSQQETVPPCRVVYLRGEFGAEVSRAAPAYALAVLASERER